MRGEAGVAVGERVRPEHAGGDRAERQADAGEPPPTRSSQTAPIIAASGIAGETVASALPATQGEPASWIASAAADASPPT